MVSRSAFADGAMGNGVSRQQKGVKSGEEDLQKGQGSEQKVKSGG